MRSSVNPRIWLVDDHANLRASAQLVLEFEGYAVESWASGSEAWDALLACDPRRLPDLILLDHQMPGMDGFHVLQKIRACDRLAAIKVVMLTGWSQFLEFPQANDCLRKPVDTGQFLRTVRRFAGDPDAACELVTTPSVLISTQPAIA